MNALARRIARMIEMDGPIGVGTFMMLALHDREMGFYATRESIGARGAFITAPEITQIFGELIGLWCAACWREQGCPARPMLVDLGPGRATLMADVLRTLRSTPDFLESLEVALVEASEKLQSLQRERLADAPVAVHWVGQWSEIADERPVFVIANEFFDALPIRQFVMTDRGWCERLVLSTEGGLGFALSPQPVSLSLAGERGRASEGAVCEICPAASAIAEDIGVAIRKNGGAALIADYGHEGRGYGDTLQALRRQAREDVLAAPGDADLSVHVDFAALAHGVRRSGAVPYGPIAQANFLRAVGIEKRGEQLARSNPDKAAEIAAAIARLTGPDAMGTLFKVLAIAPAEAPVPPGFAQC
jgi:NADH dehydrogenase [ubiquinone] 1 alpha subcomplex assembly factor 7